jgi:hypothetical protein
MSVPVTMTGGTFKAGPPVPLFSIYSMLRPGMVIRPCSPAPYATVGGRFLVAESEADVRASTINVVTSWTSRR